MLLEKENEYNNQDIYYIVKKKKNKKSKKNKKKPLFLRILKWIFIVILIFIILFLIAGGIAAYKIYEVVKDVSISKEDLVIKHENTVIKDIDGNQLGVLNGDENRVCITLDDMPQYLIDAFISIEDERFYEHNGVDIKRTLAATYTYIKNKGNSPFGGSSITQQLVKNLTNEKEDSWERKAREMVKAYYVEQELSKEEILELYLNLIFLGDTVYGVEQGSNYYFNKPASELSLAESAFLAGINHSPNSYNPFKGDDNEELIKNRTKTVLAKMYELGKISSGVEYKKAVDEVENGLNFQKGAKVEVLFSYHTDAAINQIIVQLQKENDWTYEQARLYLAGGGFVIYTTQDPDMQAKVDEEFADPKYRTQDVDENGELQDSEASMVLIDHTTGYVLAIQNGFEEKTEAYGFNLATDAKKQTGSSMKPIAVLAPAIDSKIITAATIFDDNPTSFANGTYTPKDYGAYRGLITVREAIGTSQNIPMVKAMCLLTPEKSIKFLKSIGITSLDDEKDNVLPLALGGLTWGITPLEMAGAYAAIANDGIYIKPTFYTKVVDLEGNTIIQAEQTKTRVMSAEAAYVVKEILRQPVISSNGTSKICKIEGIDTAVKTGTTNNDYDRWLCGFTPYYTATVWFGHDSNATVSGWSYSPAAQIWSSVMQKVHEGLDAKTFHETEPEGVVEVEVCNKTGFLATSTCKNSGCSYTEYFISGTEPTQNCPYHSYALVCTDSGLLANSNCPHTKKVYGRGEYISSNGLWTTQGYSKPKNIPLETCNIH